MSDLGNKQVMAKNLNYYVEKSGRTQKELAEVVGVATSTFNDWCKGKKYPRIDKIEMLANYFSILKSDLIEDKSKEHYQMQKNNDIISDAVIRMRANEDFLSVVKKLMEIDDEQVKGVNQMLNALVK